MYNTDLDVLNFLRDIEGEINQTAVDKIYLYESHLGGGLYHTTSALSFEDVYCESCGDTDMEIDEGVYGDLLNKYTARSILMVLDLL